MTTPRPGRALLEICAYSVADAVTASAAGANRIELCRDPSADGLTPRLADLRTAQPLLTHIPVHPIIRPRNSHQVTSGDLDLMCRTLALVSALGYPGAVLGALDRGRVDLAAMSVLMTSAAGLEVTFHRAFDDIADQPVALRELGDLGVARVLTSGAPGRAADHLDKLGGLIPAASQAGIILLAGGGVTPANARALLSAGITELHSSAGGSAGDLRVPDVRALASLCSGQ